MIAAVLCTALVHYEQRQQAIKEAEEKAAILLEQNQALLFYFRDQIRSKFLAVFKKRSPDTFDPALMSSFYTVDQVNTAFNKHSEFTYYYKVCALNARNPQCEADAYEAGIIKGFNREKKAPDYTAVRDIDGAPYYVVMRAGIRVQKSCARCHSRPYLAPQQLVRIYGNTRGFGWHPGDIVYAYSIRIPLAEAFAAAGKLSIKLSLFFSGALIVLFGLMTWTGNSLIFNPLNRVRTQAAAITDSAAEHLGEEIPLPRGSELKELTASFNSMSASLKAERDLMEERVEQRTANLQSTTAALETEVSEHKKTIKELQEALSQIKTLKGLLPICSHCKKIRDDEGYWQSVENYLLDHADVEFSHGICPECAKQHFGVDCDDD